MTNTNSKMFHKLKDKEYRKLFISGQIKNGLAFQIRALRQSQEMSQKDLAALTGTKQSVISRIENKVSSNLSINTLLNFANAFDVALVVRFEPINKLMDWAGNLSPEVMAPRKSDVILSELAQKSDKNLNIQRQQGTVARKLELVHQGQSSNPVQRTFTFEAPPHLVIDNTRGQTATRGESIKVSATAVGTNTKLEEATAIRNQSIA